MARSFLSSFVVMLCAVFVGMGGVVAPSSPVFAQPARLKIVVIEGEGAVNIIQQKTAVAPLVEVRDQNDLPVAGIPVTFSVSGKGATFAGGGQTLTVTSDAAGRAVASSLSPVNSGTLQINVTATLEGQTATASITQTNVTTAAEAANASRASGRGSTMSSSAAGGGIAKWVVLGSLAGAGGAAAAYVVQQQNEDSEVDPPLNGIFQGQGNDSTGPRGFSWTLTQTGASFSGRELGVLPNFFTYNGDVAGTLSGSTLTFTMSGATPGDGSCRIELAGTAQLTDRTIVGTYSGSATCLGAMSNGSFTLQKGQ